MIEEMMSATEKESGDRAHAVRACSTGSSPGMRW